MFIDELIEKLQRIKDEYGNLEVVGADDYELEDVEVQKFIQTSSDYNDIITRHTEDLDEEYLEKIYIENEEYNRHFVSKGICVKVF